MAPDLRWDLGGGPLPGIEAPAPMVVPPRARTGRLVLWSALYVGALLTAAWIGFRIGRWGEARRANLGGIANQLAIETVAWRDADLALYRTTLDPDAPATWQAERLARFEAAAPAVVTIETVTAALVAFDTADVTVAVTAAGVRLVEQRRYRAAGDSWYLSAVSPGPGPP